MAMKKNDFVSENPLILQALREVIDQRVEQVPIVEHTFSEKFERRMNKLILAQIKPYFYLINTSAKKAALAFAAAFILMITMIFSVSALREPVLRFILEVYEKFSTVFFNSHEEVVAPPETLETLYEPSWLPEGYVLENEVNTDLFRKCYFSNGTDAFEFQQNSILLGHNLDTEGAEIQQTTVLEHKAILYHNKEVWNIVWSDSEYSYAIVGMRDENQILRVAESLRKK